MVSSTSVYTLAVVAAVLVFSCNCQRQRQRPAFQFPGGEDDTAPVRPPQPQQPGDTPTLTASVTSSTERPAANPEVPVVFKPPCQCSYTPQYNPVCGSDGQTYGNIYILNCVRFCGKDVSMVLAGGCTSNRG